MTRTTTGRWAILIGINGYHESLGRLKYSVNDCRRLAEVLTTGDDAFPPDHVLVLTDNEAAERKPTYANIHSWLASWLAQPDEDDTVFVFFAGHGREMDGKCYLVPGDATLQTIHVTGIPVPYIQELLNRCKARQKVLVLDACHSGAGRDVSTMAAPMMETLSAGKGIYTLTSCDVDELSHEWDEKRQGVFSYYLAEALSGSCPPDGRGRVTADGVYEWVFDRVREWTRIHRCSQAPKRMCDLSGAVVLRHCWHASVAMRPCAVASVHGGHSANATGPIQHSTQASMLSSPAVSRNPNALAGRMRPRLYFPSWLKKACAVIAVVLLGAGFMCFMEIDKLWPGYIEHDKQTWNSLAQFLHSHNITELDCAYSEAWNSDDTKQYRLLVTQRIAASGVSVTHLTRDISTGVNERYVLGLIRMSSSGGPNISYALELRDGKGHTIWAGELYAMQ